MDDPHVLFYQGRNPMEAHMLAGLLEEHGLEPLIEQEDVSTVFGGMSPVDAGVRILIRESQRKEALDIVRDVETESRFYENDADFEPEEKTGAAGVSPFKLALNLGKYPLALWQIIGLAAIIVFTIWTVYTFYAGTGFFGD